MDLELNHDIQGVEWFSCSINPTHLLCTEYKSVPLYSFIIQLNNTESSLYMMVTSVPPPKHLMSDLESFS